MDTTERICERCGAVFLGDPHYRYVVVGDKAHVVPCHPGDTAR